MVSSLSFVLAVVLGVLALVHGTNPGDAAPHHPIHAAAHGHAHEHAPTHTAPPRLGKPSPPATPAPTVPSNGPHRRLFGVQDVWSWLSDKQRGELLQHVKDKLTATQHETNQATPTPPARRLVPKSPSTPPEMGSMFHVLRFFANRVGDVNDDAFTEQERLAALRASSSSSSSSSSMDADATRAAAFEASLAKAAQAYGLTSPPSASAAPPSPTTTSPSSSTPPPTAQSLLTGIEW